MSSHSQRDALPPPPGSGAGRADDGGGEDFGEFGFGADSPQRVQTSTQDEEFAGEQQSAGAQSASESSKLLQRQGEVWSTG